jgi:hypothetical protein
MCASQSTSNLAGSGGRNARGDVSEASLAASSAALANDTHANRCCPRALAVLGPSVRLGREKTSGRMHLRVRELSSPPPPPPTASTYYLRRVEFSDAQCTVPIHAVVQAYDGTTCIADGTMYYTASIAPSSSGAVASSYVAKITFYSDAACTVASQPSQASEIFATAVADSTQTSFTFVAGQCITGGAAGTNAASTMYDLTETFPQIPPTLSGTLTKYYSSSSCATPRHAEFTAPGYCRCDGGHCWVLLLTCHEILLLYSRCACGGTVRNT